MEVQSKTRLILRHNMVKLLGNHGGLGAGITEDRINAIHFELTSGLGGDICQDRGVMKNPRADVPQIAQAVAKGLGLIDGIENPSAAEAAKAGGEILRAVSTLRPFNSFNDEVACVLSAKVMEQMGYRVGFHRMLAQDIRDTVAMANIGHPERMEKIIEHLATPIAEEKAPSPISMENVSSRLAAISEEMDDEPNHSPKGPGL